MQRAHLGAVADDARVGQQSVASASAHRRPGVRGRSPRRRAIAIAPAKDGDPGEPRLGALQAEQLEERAVIGDRHAPLGVVVRQVERVRLAPAAPHQIARVAHGLDDSGHERGRWTLGVHLPRVGVAASARIVAQRRQDRCRLRRCPQRAKASGEARPWSPVRPFRHVAERRPRRRKQCGFAQVEPNYSHLRPPFSLGAPIRSAPSPSD